MSPLEQTAGFYWPVRFNLLNTTQLYSSAVSVRLSKRDCDIHLDVGYGSYFSRFLLGIRAISPHSALFFDMCDVTYNEKLIYI